MMTHSKTHTAMSTALIIKQENIQTIMSAAPQSYQDNAISRTKCIEAGQAILSAIQQGGMTDDLDQQAAAFIEKARKTVKKMNERRSPVTKLFDDIRKEFTTMENDIDPTKADTVPYKLQQLRNQFAAKKRAEEEERRRIEYERQQAEQARQRLAQDIEDDFKKQFQVHINCMLDTLTGYDNAITLENYDHLHHLIEGTLTELPNDILPSLRTTIRIPAGVTIEELRKVEQATKDRLAAQFAEQYNFEIESTKQYILDRLPSKKANLERIAQANAEEAARIKAEMEARQRREAELLAAERRRQEEEERQKAELARQQAEMEGLFAAQAVAQEYQPKTKVTKKIELLNPEGIMPIFSMWWSKEGSQLTVDELAKMFKRQITFCEKLAKDGILIQDESVNYVDEVKAK